MKNEAHKSISEIQKRTKFNVVVLANSKKESIEKLDNITYKIKVSVPAEGGRANKRVCEILAKHFEVSRNNVNIISGEKSKVKIIKLTSSRKA